MAKPASDKPQAQLELRKHPQLGPVLKQLRKRVRLSQSDVAREVDRARKRRGESKPMTTTWYAKIENRTNSYPSAADLEAILDLLGSDEDEVRSLIEEATGETWSSPVAKATDSEPSPTLSMRSFDSTDRKLVSRAAGSGGQQLSGAPGPLAASYLATVPLAAEDASLEAADPIGAHAGIVDEQEVELLSSFRQLTPKRRRQAIAQVRSVLAMQRAEGEES